jgi:hypothetical protein
MNSRLMAVVAMYLLAMMLVSARADSIPGFALSTATHRAGPGWVQLNDPYLSSLHYSGMGFRMELAEQRYLRASDDRFSMINQLSGLMAITTNPASTAQIETVAGTYSFGLRYHYRGMKQLVVLAGGAVEADGGVRVNSRNVNNPVNVDIAVNLNATLGARYLLPTPRRTLQFDVQTELPFAGIMFVPYPGHSYYELYLSKQLSEALFFSSFHNRQGAKLSVSADVPLGRTTLHAAWKYRSTMYRGNGPVFSFNEHSLLLGITYDLFRSSGRRVQFPANYIRVH